MTAPTPRASPVGKRSGIIRFVSVATPVGTSASERWTSLPRARARSNRATPPGALAASIERLTSNVRKSSASERTGVEPVSRIAGWAAVAATSDGQCHEPEAGRPRGKRAAAVTRGSSARAGGRRLACRKRDEGYDECQPDERGPRGEEDELCKGRHHVRILRLPPSPAPSGCGGSRCSAAVGRRDPRGVGLGSSTTAPSTAAATSRSSLAVGVRPGPHAPPARNAASACSEAASRAAGPAPAAASAMTTPSTTSALARSRPSAK